MLTDSPRREELLDTYRTLFTSPLGDVVLRDLRYQFFEPVGYQPGLNSPEDAVFYAGQRHVVNYIMEAMQPPPIIEVEKDGGDEFD